MIWRLFFGFFLVSLLAFGGGQAAIPLVERLAVAETGWVSADDFSASVALGYVTPGPVLITATFIGCRAAGLPGAIAATVGVFLMPWLLAASAAGLLRRFMQHRWLRGFGRGAGPAVVGLLGVTTMNLIRPSASHWTLLAYTAVALVLALSTKVHPVLILVGGTLLGMAVGH